MAITVFDAVGKFHADTSELDQYITKLERGLASAEEKAAAAAANNKKAQDELRAALRAVNAEGGATAENQNRLAGAIKNSTLAAQSATRANSELKDSLGVVKQSSHEATGEAALLGEAFGIHLPRHVRTFLASIPGVSTALKGAFAITAVGFLIEALAQIPGKIKEVTAELAGWTKEAQAAYDAQIKLNRAFLDEAQKREEAKVRENERGLQGAELARTQIANDSKILELQRARIQAAGDLAGKLRQQREALARGQGDLTAGGLSSLRRQQTAVTDFLGLTNAPEEIKKLDKQIEDLDARVRESHKSREDLEQQDADRQAGYVHQSLEEFTRNETAKLEAKRRGDEAQIDLDIAKTRLEVLQGTKTLADLVLAERTAEEQKYQNQQDAQKKRLGLLAKDPTKNAAELASLNGELQAEQREHDAKLLNDESDYLENRRKLDELLGEKSLLPYLAGFHEQIEQAEREHSARLVEIVTAEVENVQKVRRLIAANAAALTKEISKGDFLAPIAPKIELSPQLQAAVEATRILSQLGVATAESGKRAGDATAAYDLLVQSLGEGVKAEDLLTASVKDFGASIKNIDVDRLQALRAVLTAEIQATEDWGGSTTDLEHKLAAVNKQLEQMGVRVDDLGKRSQKALSPITSIFAGVIKGSLPAGAALRQFGSISAEAIGMSVAAAVSGSQDFDEAMKQFLKSTLSTLAGEAVVQAIVETAKGFAALSPLSPDFGHAGEHFASAAIWASVGVAAAAAGSFISTGGSGGSGASAPATQAAGGAGAGAATSTRNVPHLATGGLVTGPTLAVIGDSVQRGRSATEIIAPLDDPESLRKIAAAAGGGGNTHVEIHIDSDLDGMIRKISKRVSRGDVHLAATSAKVLKR